MRIRTFALSLAPSLACICLWILLCAVADLGNGGMTDTATGDHLEALGTTGFASWYRQMADGHDGWSGVTHVYAVWVHVGIKPRCATR